jgi:D-serine deaminase-like pyridoxal phosphate-dependent protein
VSVVPNHACVVANLFDRLVVVQDGEPVARWRVDARGRSD